MTRSHVRVLCHRVLELYYRRAVAADPYNALVLRELDSYLAPYDKYGFDYRDPNRFVAATIPAASHGTGRHGGSDNDEDGGGSGDGSPDGDGDGDGDDDGVVVEEMGAAGDGQQQGGGFRGWRGPAVMSGLHQRTQQPRRGARQFHKYIDAAAAKGSQASQGDQSDAGDAWAAGQGSEAGGGVEARSVTRGDALQEALRLDAEEEAARAAEAQGSDPPPTPAPTPANTSAYTRRGVRRSQVMGKGTTVSSRLRLDLNKVSAARNPASTNARVIDSHHAKVLLDRGSVARDSQRYDVEAVLATVDGNRNPAKNECPLCVPGARCVTCQFHKRWVSRMVRKRHQQIVEFDPPYVLSSSESEGEPGPEGIGEARAYWKVRQCMMIVPWDHDCPCLCELPMFVPPS